MYVDVCIRNKAGGRFVVMRAHATKGRSYGGKTWYNCAKSRTACFGIEAKFGRTILMYLQATSKVE